MSKYTIEFTARAERALRRLDHPIAQRVRGVIIRLADDPFPPASTALAGSKGDYRLRTADYRIIYRVQHDRLVVLIIDVGPRREVYRWANTPSL